MWLPATVDTVWWRLMPASTIESKILDVVQMNFVMADSRPKCLVIDESDGALGDDKGAVDVVLKMVAGDKRSESGTESIVQSDQSRKESSKKKRKDTPLLRPAICICNNLYAPTLRPLRQVAKQQRRNEDKFCCT